jgi:hypothetical protein
MDTSLGIELVGYEGPSMIRSGDELPLTILWQTDREWKTSLDVRLSLELDDGLPLSEVEARVSPVTSGWQAGEVVSQAMLLEVPPGTAPVEHDLVLEWQESSPDGSAEAAGGSLSMGTVTVLRPLVPLPTPRMPHEPWANFGDALQLTGYELSAPDVEPGGELRVTLLWRAWDTPLPVIVSGLELRDTEGRVMAQEQRGLGGAYTSTLWGHEELVRGVYAVRVPEGISSGTHALTLTLQAVRADGEQEVLPFWSDAGVWEESFALGTLNVVDPQR